MMIFWLVIGVGIGYFFNKQIDVYVKKGIKYLRDKSGSDKDRLY